MNNPRLDKLLTLFDEKNPDDFLLFALAKEYENGDDLDTALEYYQRLKTHNPEYVGLYYHLAKLYEQQELFEEALDIYKEGMAVAKTQGDQHALAELSNAKLNLELEEGL